MATAYFTKATFDFLRELAANNRKDWFAENKERYQADVQRPAMRFVTDFGAPLRRISRNFRADPRPVGGSLFRIHRDTRFSRDKSPYKTHLGIQFRHDLGKDVHAPGFYVHLEPGNVFVGAGILAPGRGDAEADPGPDGGGPGGVEAGEPGEGVPLTVRAVGRLAGARAGGVRDRPSAD